MSRSAPAQPFVTALSLRRSANLTAALPPLSRLLRATSLASGLILGAGSIPAVPGPAMAETAQADGLLADAEAQIQNGQPRAAMIQLRNALQADPQNWRARRLLGELYLSGGRAAEAEKELRRAFQGQAEPATGLLLAQALLSLGKPAEALALLEPLRLEDAAEASSLPLLKAEALLALGRPEEAEATLAPVLAASPLNEAASLLDARIGLAEGDLSRAGTRIERALEVDRSSVPAWLLKAQLATAAGSYDAALAAIDRAAELAPDNQQIRVSRAELLIRRAQYDEAEQILRAVLASEPKNIAANYFLATIQTSRGQLADADATLRQVGDLGRDVDELTLLAGIVKLGLKQDGQAEALLGKYLARVPANLTIRRLLAALQIRTERPRAAIDTMAAVTGAAAADATNLQLLSSAELRAGETEAAKATLARLVTLGAAPGKQAAAMLAVLDPKNSKLPAAAGRETALVLDQLRSGEGARARDAAKALTERFPSNPIILNLAGLTMIAAGDDEQAAQALFERASTLDPSYPDPQHNLDRLDIRAGRFDALESRLRARLVQGADAETSAVQLAELLNGRERRNEALLLLRQAAAAAPKSIALRQALLIVTSQAGLQPEASAVAQELLALGAAGLPLGYSAAGDYYYRVGDYAAALDSYLKLKSVLPDQPPLLVAIAQTQYRTGDRDAARATLAELRALRPTSPIANNSLVDLDLQAKDYGSALALTEQLQPEAPEQAARLRSKVLLAKNEPAAAEATLVEALARTPSSDLARELFLLRRQLGRHEVAMQGLRSWIAKHPADVAAMDTMGDALVERGDYEAALGVFERANQLALNDPILLNDLSWVRHKLGRPGARELAQRAYQITPAPEIADTLGWIMVNEGKVEAGLPLLREAYQARQDNPDIRYHLAFALDRTGDAATARSLLAPLDGVTTPFMEQQPAQALRAKLGS